MKFMFHSCRHCIERKFEANFRKKGNFAGGLDISRHGNTLSKAETLGFYKQAVGHAFHFCARLPYRLNTGGRKELIL
jgi:tetrahydromethanopterin S-methyltransferase subunit E